MVPLALQNTFELLAKASSATAVPVLEQALRCPVPSIRIEAARVLVRRGGTEEMRSIVRCLDRCTHEELSFLGTCSGLLEAPIDFAIHSQDIVSRQQGLIAVARLQLAPLLHHIVQAAENVEDELQIVAIQLLNELACDAGERARWALLPHKGASKMGPSSNKSPTQARESDKLCELPSEHFRTHLLHLLRSSIADFDSHRVRAILDAWLQASHWEDTGFQSLFSPFPDQIAPLALRRLQQLRNSGIDDLLVGSYWSEASSLRCLEIVASRPPWQVLKALFRIEQRFGVTTAASNNLVAFPIPVINDITGEKLQKLSVDDTGTWLRLLAGAKCSADVVLNGVCTLAQLIESDPDWCSSHSQDQVWDAELEANCIRALADLQAFKPSIASLALSDGLPLAPDLTPYESPPWKAGLRTAIERVLEAFTSPNRLPSKVRAAIERLFQDFTVADLTQTIDSWPTDHTIAFARIAMVFDRPFEQAIARETNNPSPIKRKNAYQLLQLLEPTPWVTELAFKGFEDPHRDVRIEAMKAFARSPNPEVVKLGLAPLLQDNSSDIVDAIADLLAIVPNSQKTLHGQVPTATR